MLFKSPVFSQASGSIAGITYSHNRSGMYTRARTVPVNPTSPGQVAMRMYMSQAVSMWVSGSGFAIDRNSWRTYAQNTAMTNKLGDQVYLTGQQQWLRTATVALQAGLDPVTLFGDAPTTFNLGDTGTLGPLAASEATQGVNVPVTNTPGWAADDDANCLIWLGFPQNLTVNYYRGPYRGVTAISGDSMTPVTAAQATASGQQVFVANQAVFARVRVLQSDGRLSSSQYLRATAGA